MIKMVAPSMANRVIDHSILVSTDSGSVVSLNHLQQMQNSLSSCPLRTLTTRDFPFPPQNNAMKGPIPSSILNMWKQSSEK